MLSKCPICGAETVKGEIKKHHFQESGLLNAYIDTMVYSCANCQGECISIFRASDVLAELGSLVVVKPSILLGREVRYLRKNLMLSRAHFSRFTGIDFETLRSYEEENEDAPISQNIDRVVRCYYAIMAKCKESVLDELRALLTGPDKIEDKNFEYYLKPEWSAA